MNQPVETPVMGLPREEMMRLALATRTMATLLREIRERRGRAAWDDTNNAARKRAAAMRPMIGRFSHADLGEWNRLSTESIRSELHEESGMTIRVGPLSNGRFGVQAGWADHHAETVAGSKDMADRITDWLRANASHEAVDVMHLSSEEMHNTGTAGRARRQGREQRDTAGGRKLTEFEQAREWVSQHRPEYYADWKQQYSYADTIDGRRIDKAELIRFWRTEKAAEAAEQGSAQGPETGGESSRPRQRPLADRLRGKVPDRVLDDARWETAEQQFASLVAEGADPDQLVAAVAAIDFDSGKVRAPSGFAAWVMRDAAKNGRARSTTSEDEARRDVAQEWLDSADASSPFDRARAATLVGEIDDEFDAALAKKFPGILDSEEPAASAAPDAEAAESSEDEEHHDENTVFVVDHDGEVIEVPFVAAEPTAAETTQADSTEEASASADHEPGEERTAAAAAGASAEAAQAVMTPPSASKSKSQQRSHSRRRGAPPVNEPTQHRTRGHSH